MGSRTHSRSHLPPSPDLNEECAVLKEQTQNMLSNQSRTQTPVSTTSDTSPLNSKSHPEDMSLSDLVVRPNSNTNMGQPARPSSSLAKERERPLSATITSTNPRRNVRLADSLSHARRGSYDIRDLNQNGVNGINGMTSSTSASRNMNILNVNESPNVAAEKRRSIRREADSNQNPAMSVSVSGLNLTPRSAASAVSRARDRVPISGLRRESTAAAAGASKRNWNASRSKIEALQVINGLCSFSKG